MGSIKPNGDKVKTLDDVIMFIEGDQIVIEFTERIRSFGITHKQATEFHEKLGEAIGVLEDEIQNRHLPESSTDT
jgi:hypothetical protein